MTQTIQMNSPSHYHTDNFVGTIGQVGPSAVEIIVSTDGAEQSGGISHQIGDFIVILSGDCGIVGQLSNIRLVEDANQKSVVIATAQLLTTVDFNGGAVTPGVKHSPHVGNRAYIARSELIQRIAETRDKYKGRDAEVLLSIASLAHADNTPVSFTPENLFGRHLAVLGTTGAGKSWSVARITEQCANHQSKVILIDATGEFGQLQHGVRHVYLGHDPNPMNNATQVVLPYFQLTESDLFEIFRPAGQSQAPKLRAAMKTLKLLSEEPSLSLDGAFIKASKNKQRFEQAYRQHSNFIDSPFADFDIGQLAQQIENECINPTRSALEPLVWGDYNGLEQAACTPLVNRVNDIVRSQELSPIFQPYGKSSLIDEINAFLKDRSLQVLRISLQYLSFAHHAREIIANATGRLLLKLAREERFKNQPLLVILDEAHQFLNRETADTSNEFSLDSFSMIAKEGRKYSLSICLATQRPRDIPDGVLSQMGTLLVHRLINDADRGVIERASTDMDRSAMAALPTLAPGEAVLIGVDFPVPMTVKMETPIAQPQSAGPNYQKHWK